MEELAGDVDPDDYVDFDDIAFSMPAADAGSISCCQKIRKEITENMKTQLTRLWMYQAMET